MWLVVDAFARWLRETLGYAMQLRIAVLLLAATLPGYPLGFFLASSWWERGMWWMSDAALTYGALSIIPSVEAAQEASDGG